MDQQNQHHRDHQHHREHHRDHQHHVDLSFRKFQTWGLGGFPALLAATVAVCLLGWWATAEATRGSDDHDPSEIVIDEVAGIWIALWPLSAGMWHAGADPWLFPWPGWVAAFVLFRAFDILKPGPVGWADRRGDALGVMLDDVIAGVLAALGVVLFAWVAHGIAGA